MACLTLAAAAFVEEDFTLVEGPTSAPMNEGDVTEIFFAEEEPTTKKAATMRVPSTTTAKPVAVVDAVVEAAPIAATTPRTRKSSSRTRMSGSNRRKQQSKPKVAAEPAVEEENAKAESTSPASVDTASVAILAPKNFKPTPRPLNEFQETQGLMEFLKKRKPVPSCFAYFGHIIKPNSDALDLMKTGKFERIQASTTPDPFASILATATAPSTEESVTVAIEKSVFSSKRFFWESFDIDLV